MRSSTRATSLGSLVAQYDPGFFAGSSSTSVPASTSCLQRSSCSSGEPSSQWTSSGSQSSTISWTQANKRGCWVGASVTSDTTAGLPGKAENRVERVYRRAFRLAEAGFVAHSWAAGLDSRTYVRYDAPTSPIRCWSCTCRRVADPSHGGGKSMFERVEALRDELQGVITRLEPVCIDARDAKWLVEVFAEMERLCAAGKTLAAGRVAGTKVWADDGDRSAANWLARTSGTSVSAAVGVLETARRLDDLPATDAAFRAGRLSVTQAEYVASGAAADPSAEGALLDAAAITTVNGSARRIPAGEGRGERRRARAVRARAALAVVPALDRCRRRVLRELAHDARRRRLPRRRPRELPRADLPGGAQRPTAASRTRRTTPTPWWRWRGPRCRVRTLPGCRRTEPRRTVSSKSAPRAMIHFRVDYQAYLRRPHRARRGVARSRRSARCRSPPCGGTPTTRSSTRCWPTARR